MKLKLLSLIFLFALVSKADSQINFRIATLKDPAQWFDYGLFKPIESYDLYVEQRSDGTYRLHYGCPVMNLGNKDFTAPRGVPLVNMTRIKLYTQNGSQSVKFKSSYNFDANCIQTLQCNYTPYPDSLMVFYQNMQDVYFNSVDGIQPGANAVVPTFDYPNYAQEPESTRADNTACLAFWFDPATMMATWDSSLVRKYFWPKPPTNLRATTNFKGKVKTVTLNWETPDDEVEIFKDGIALNDEYYYKKYYIDTVSGGFKGATYSIRTERDGIGLSTFSTITVSK